MNPRQINMRKFFASIVTKKEDPFEYYEIDENSVGTLRYTGANTTATVPSRTDGVDVIEVGPFTFAGNDTITSVTISDGVEKLN